MSSYQCFIFFILLKLTLGVHLSIIKGQNITFPLPELPVGTSINEIEWKYHPSNGMIMLARIFLNKNQSDSSKLYSKRAGMHIMENGTLHIEDIKDEDSGNYSCTIIFHDHRMRNQQIYLQVLHDPTQQCPVSNSTSKPSEPHFPLLIAIAVCSVLTIVLTVTTIGIFKCRKKCSCTSNEPIYMNKTAVRKARKSQVTGH